MKRSKIFLGLTTAILSVIGVAAAKRFAGTTRFYVTTNEGYCASRSSILCIFKSDGSHVGVTVISGTIFPLFTKGPAGVLTANNCRNLLRYDQTGE